MALAQLTYRESLRDIEASLRAMDPKLYHMGIHSTSSRNNLSNANENHDWRIYAEFILITEGNVHDVNVLDHLVPLPGAYYVMDRGYLDFDENLFNDAGKKCPLLNAALEFGLAFGGDGIGFALPAFADKFGSACKPAGFFHFRQMRIEPPIGGLEYPPRQVGEFLPSGTRALPRDFEEAPEPADPYAPSPFDYPDSVFL